MYTDILWHRGNYEKSELGYGPTAVDCGFWSELGYMSWPLIFHAGFTDPVAVQTKTSKTKTSL